MLYNAALVPAVQQSESALCILYVYISPLPPQPPSQPHIPTLKVVTQHRAGLPVLQRQLPTSYLFNTGSVFRTKTSPPSTNLTQVVQRKRTCLPMQEMQETQFQPLGWEDPLKEEVATPSSVLTWESP